MNVTIYIIDLDLQGQISLKTSKILVLFFLTGYLNLDLDL